MIPLWAFLAAVVLQAAGAFAAATWLWGRGRRP
jgi:hypothetical protein